MKNIIFVLCLFVVCACSSAQKMPEPQAPAPAQVPVTDTKQVNEAQQIDLLGLQRHLGLDRSKRDVGYQEKTFNTCDVGFGYPTQNCKNQTLVSIFVLLQCRDTTGTTSDVVTSAQLDPIANKQLKWEVANRKFSSNTDGEGFAQLIGVLPSSPKTSRLRISVGQQFVYVRAGEVSRIVTPSNWCR